jgi:splicing factor U2AF subunit
MSSRAQSEKGSETAARTRPLSIQEILLRREKKAAAEAKKAAAGEAKKTRDEPKDNEKGKPNHAESGRGHKTRKDLKDVPAEGSRRESVRDAAKEDSRKDDVRHVSKEGSKKDGARYAPREASKKENLNVRPKDGPRVDELKDAPKVPRKDDQRDAAKKGSKKERSSTRDGSQSAAKDKDAHVSHKLSTGTRGRPAESRDGNHGEIRGRNGDAARPESLRGPAERWNGEPVHNDRIKERSDILRNEAKRKFHGFDDQRRPYVDRPVLMKHDSARFQVSKHYDRNDGRREYGKAYYEEPRPKRRRSRSREYDQGRRDRSFSLSPREQRRSYHGHDHDGFFPGRKYAENDRHRSSGNGGGHDGGSYQRHESPLGGYSPRKRKTVPQDEQASTNITPPAVRSPEKKQATWDQAPAGADQSNFFTTSKPTVSQTSSASVSFSAPKPNLATTSETILTGNSASIDSVQLTQATRPLRRLHIENLTSSASEDMLIGCLNAFLLSSGGNHVQRSKQPCLSCMVSQLPSPLLVICITLPHFLRNIYPHAMFIQCR